MKGLVPPAVVVLWAGIIVAASGPSYAAHGRFARHRPLPTTFSNPASQAAGTTSPVDESDSAPSREAAAQARGFECYHRREFDEAIRQFTEAIRLEPGDSLNYRLVSGS
jgi:hypothetical protein